jgi:protein CpxP
MSQLNNLFGGSPPARTTLMSTVASLLGAVILVGPVGVAAQTAPAQPTATYHHQVAHRTAAQARETVENRITSLHGELKITLDQESKWAAVAQVMRDNEADMQRLIAQRRAEAPRAFTAVEDLKTYERFTQEHVNGLKNLISSFETLYASMPPSQQAVADHVFMHFGHRDRSLKS